MTQTEHVHAICCRLEVDDVISGLSIMTIQGCAMVRFEGANFSTFRDFPKRSFCDSKVGDGSDGTNVTCSRWEVAADDVISGNDVDTFRYYACVNLRVAIFR